MDMRSPVTALLENRYIAFLFYVSFVVSLVGQTVIRAKMRNQSKDAELSSSNRRTD